MKQTVLGLILALFFLGCGDKSNVEVTKQTVVGNSLEQLTLNDQFGKPHSLNPDTKTVIFAFTKAMGHLSNDFLAKQDPGYLAEHNAVFVADVSAAPSLIRSMFIMPGLKEFKHTVLVIDDENTAASYRIDAHQDTLMILDIKDYIIENIRYVNTQEELAEAL